jgi:hypothetical protein
MAVHADAIARRDPLSEFGAHAVHQHAAVADPVLHGAPRTETEPGEDLLQAFGGGWRGHGGHDDNRRAFVG